MVDYVVHKGSEREEKDLNIRSSFWGFQGISTAIAGNISQITITSLLVVDIPYNFSPSLLGRDILIEAPDEAGTNGIESEEMALSDVHALGFGLVVPRQAPP